jgi:Mn2+/Fe2+ NRAMP family transporter
VLQIVGSYRLIERIFKWLALSLLAYIGAALLAKPDPGTVLWHTFVPTIRFDAKFLGGLVAIIGSTFSPYLYFWQASQEVEGKVAIGQRKLHQRRGTSDNELKYAAWDVNAGMIASNTVTYFVVLASAATLFAAGQHDVQSAEQLATSLRPLAGDAAGVLLTLGLIGTGMLAVPVLTTSAAYAVAEACRWKHGLDRKASHAKGFYGVIVASTAIGLSLNFLGISPITALYWTSVIYGFMVPPLLTIIILISSNRKIMGERSNGRGIAVLGWSTVVASTLAAVGMLTLGGR